MISGIGIKFELKNLQELKKLLIDAAKQTAQLQETLEKIESTKIDIIASLVKFEEKMG
jgi:hypothetical protein|nr:MAG TPA: hypothetical protein [Caudoviricetes sp.]